MLRSKDKISVRQVVLFLLVTIICSPSVRLFPNYTAVYAKQAGWLAPFVSFVVMIPMIYIYHSFFKKYKSESFVQIVCDICGKIAGYIIISVYVIWITVLLTLYVRYYAERLVSTIFPNVNILVFIIAMLISVAFILRSGIEIIARMNEIILPLLVIILASMFVFSIPDIKISRLTPISYLDILPVLKANIEILGIWSYYSFVLIFSDVINNKEKIKSVSFQSISLITVLAFMIITMSIGTLSASVIQMMPIPYFFAVKQISIFATIERIESFVVSFWVFSDFVLISVFTFIVMNMIKNMFSLRETKHFISIYLLFILFLSLYISRSSFELQSLSEHIMIPGNVVLGFIVPVIIFAVGKIRKKI